MKQALEVIGEMETAGVIGRYAISGAVAAFNYIEAAVTEDLDILVAFDAETAKGSSGPISLTPIYSYLSSKVLRSIGRRESLLVDGQFNSYPWLMLSTQKLLLRRRRLR